MTQSNLTVTHEDPIPESYQKTEFGVIPENWQVKKLGDISTIYSGGTPNRKVNEYWDGSIPWITTTLINGGEIKEAQEFITTKGYENSSAKWCEKDTILMAMYGQGKTRGKVGKLTFGATINQACAAIKLEENYNVNYILSFLNSKYEAIRELSNSGGQENLSGSIVKSIPILIPSSKEQAKIATALSDTDALISELEKLIEKKQAIKTATMQQLLTGKTRLPEFALREDGTPKGYKGSELGQIPEDWAIKKLSDLATVKTGGTPSTVNNLYWNGGYLWCTPTDITALKGRKYLTSTSRKLSKLGIENSSAEVLPIDTIVMSSRATIGECAILKKQASTNQGFKNFICFDGTSNEYIYYLLTTLKHDFIGLCSGSTFLEISTTQVRNFKVKIPRFDEQLAISAVLSNMDTEIVQLNLKLAKVKNIKQGMMQELLTGKTRLV